MPINIADLGAAGDGKTINTEIINTAIRRASQEKSGHVVVPPGVFVSGTIQLMSHVKLELMSGAVLLASPDISDFPFRKLDPGEKDHPDHQPRHFIQAGDLEDICICGEGTIDANGEAYAVPKKKDRKPYTWFGYGRDHCSPVLSFRHCSNVRLSGITVCNSTGWNVHLYNCNNVQARNMQILNDFYAGHSDGFDIDGCRDVLIDGCRIETGDDAIVLKTLPGSQSCERIIVSNCILRSTCAAFKIGTESFNDFKQILFTNSIVHHSSRAFEIVIFDGGNVEDVTVSNIIADTNSGINMNRPIHIDVAKRRVRKTEGYNERLGSIKRVTISNITLNTDGRILLTAADGAMLEQIRLHNISVHMPWIEDPVAVDLVSDQMQSSNASPQARLARSVIVASCVKDLNISGISITYPTSAPGEGFIPKYEKGSLVRDPRSEFLPMPDFGVFWGRIIDGGTIDLAGTRSSKAGVPAIDIQDVNTRIAGE